MVTLSGCVGYALGDEIIRKVKLNAAVFHYYCLMNSMYDSQKCSQNLNWKILSTFMSVRWFLRNFKVKLVLKSMKYLNLHTQ